MFAWMATPEGWLALVVLLLLEIALGIDNVVFIAGHVARLPSARAEIVRRIGLLLALVLRVALVLVLAHAMNSADILIGSVSGRDLFLIGGGLFLIVKGAQDLYSEVGPGHAQPTNSAAPRPASLPAALVKIAIIDLFFAVDSVVVAFAMVGDIGIMLSAVLLSVLALYVGAGPVARFLAAHPGLRLLALAFVTVLGIVMLGEGLGYSLPRGLVHGAAAVSLLVGIINVLAARRAATIRQARQRARLGPAAQGAGSAPP